MDSDGEGRKKKRKRLVGTEGRDSPLNQQRKISFSDSLQAFPVAVHHSPNSLGHSASEISFNERRNSADTVIQQNASRVSVRTSPVTVHSPVSRGHLAAGF